MINLESTFKGVHHLKGGDSRLKIWIEEFDSGAANVIMTESGKFTGNRKDQYCESLGQAKESGEYFNRTGFNRND